MSKMFKLTSLVVGLAMVLSFVAVPASAATVDELMAQIATLTAQIAALKGGATATTATTFTRDLTVGSKGEDVSALQQILIDSGYLDVVAPTGYFGGMTKAALVKYQKENGISATGYFGPKTRAFVGSTAGTTTTTGGSTVTSITTPGVEGSLTVSANPTPSSGKTIREGDSNVDVLGLKLEAKYSDIAIQRIKVDLGASTVFYNKLFSKISLVDPNGTVLAQSDLNSSTVVKEGTQYYISLAGFNYVVPKDSTKVLTLRLSAWGSIDSTYDSNATYGLLIPQYGVRGVDGAAINQMGPATEMSRRTVTVGASALADAATMTVSKNSGSPVAQTIIANDGTSDNEKDGVVFLTFDVRTTKDNLKITDLNASIQKTGSGAATATTAYLVVDGTTIGSATVNTSTGFIAFNDIDYTISANTTKTFTLKADVRNANGTAAVMTASTTGANFTVENSTGTTIVPTGSATGESITVRSAGAQVTLMNKSIASIVNTNTTSGLSTTTVDAKFTLKVEALGADVLLGTEASTSPMFASSTTYFLAYQGDTAQSITPSFLTFVVNGLTASGNTMTIANGNYATVDVNVQYKSRSAAGATQLSGAAAVGIAGVRSVSSGGSVTDDFMSGKTDWRTSSTAITN